MLHERISKLRLIQACKYKDFPRSNTLKGASYSYIALARAARDLMSMNGGSILSLSFDASRWYDR